MVGAGILCTGCSVAGSLHGEGERRGKKGRREKLDSLYRVVTKRRCNVTSAKFR